MVTYKQAGSYRILSDKKGDLEDKTVELGSMIDEDNHRLTEREMAKLLRDANVYGRASKKEKLKIVYYKKKLTWND